MEENETFLNKSLHLQSIDILTKMPRNFNDKRIVISTSGAGKIVYHMKKYEFGLQPNTVYKKKQNLK